MQQLDIFTVEQPVTMKFIDLFSGIGGFRTGMEMNGHECVAFCEIDKYARQSYKAVYDTEGEEEWHDITQVSNDDFRCFRGQADVITGGFPCQAFSIAGKRRGFEDTRGTLFFDIARAIKEIQPSYALLENVKGLFSHDKGRTFGTIIQALDELGYVVEWGLFNSKFWGVPQNRERVFILATRKDIFRQPKLINLLNKQTEVNTRLLDLIEDEVDEKYYLSGEKTEKLIAMIDEKYNVKEATNVIKQIGNIDQHKRERNNPNSGRVYDPSGISPTLSTMQGGGLEPKIVEEIKLELVGSLGLEGYAEMSNRVYSQEGLARTLMGGGGNAGDKTGLYLEPCVRVEGVADRTRCGKKTLEPNGKEYANALTSVQHDSMALEKPGLRVRKLTPLECWRLQGFTDEQFYKAKNDGVSNSQLYKQAGNSVTVNVIDAIARKLL